jgi:hypothetical protein
MLNPNILRDWFEEQQFPEVHKIVLGKLSKLLMIEFDDNLFAVYVMDAKGLFRSSPLIAAGIGSKLEMIKLLIEFGAEIDATNPEGWTALQAVIKAQNVECANILLTRGTDLGYISKNGHSALTTAIIYNSHAVLRLFLIGWYHTNHLKGLQLLPIIAGSADVKTMSILGASALKQTLLNRYDFAAGYEILQSRTDYDERLGNAFNEFLSVAGPKRK